MHFHTLNLNEDVCVVSCKMSSRGLWRRIAFETATRIQDLSLPLSRSLRSSQRPRVRDASRRVLDQRFQLDLTRSMTDCFEQMTRCTRVTMHQKYNSEGIECTTGDDLVFEFTRVKASQLCKESKSRALTLARINFTLVISWKITFPIQSYEIVTVLFSCGLLRGVTIPRS